MTGIPQVGEPAPDFTLQDVHGTPVTLSDLRGTPVLVVFFPFAFSGICAGEMCEIRDNLEDFESAITLLRAERDAAGIEPPGRMPSAHSAG